MRLFVLIIIFNFMTRVFESNVLNGKYLGGYSMNLFETWVCCTNFYVLLFGHLSSCGHDEKKSEILP